MTAGHTTRQLVTSHPGSPFGGTSCSRRDHRAWRPALRLRHGRRLQRDAVPQGRLRRPVLLRSGARYQPAACWRGRGRAVRRADRRPDRAAAHGARPRGAAMSVATIANWAANFVVTISFLSIKNAIGGMGVFLLFGALTLVAL